jgi:hypothetical protein
LLANLLMIFEEVILAHYIAASAQCQ